jgi:hypothetical protein
MPPSNVQSGCHAFFIVVPPCENRTHGKPRHSVVGRESIFVQRTEFLLRHFN